MNFDKFFAQWARGHNVFNGLRCFWVCFGDFVCFGLSGCLKWLVLWHDAVFLFYFNFFMKLYWLGGVLAFVGKAA